MKLLKPIIITLLFALFLVSAFLLFEPSDSPSGYFTYTPALAVFNSENNAELNSNLEIRFLTKSTNDLEISPIIGNTEFISLKCQDKEKDFSVDQERLVSPSYTCPSESSIIVKILSPKTELNIKFGQEIQSAENIIS